LPQARLNAPGAPWSTSSAPRAPRTAPGSSCGSAPGATFSGIPRVWMPPGRGSQPRSPGVQDARSPAPPPKENSAALSGGRRATLFQFIPVSSGERTAGPLKPGIAATGAGAARGKGVGPRFCFRLGPTPRAGVSRVARLRPGWRVIRLPAELQPRSCRRLLPGHPGQPPPGPQEEPYPKEAPDLHSCELRENHNTLLFTLEDVDSSGHVE